jgi:hypothetical protein
MARTRPVATRVARPRRRLAERQAGKIDEFLLGDPKLGPGFRKISPGGGGGDVERGLIVRIAAGGDQFEPLDGLGGRSHGCKGGRDFPIRLHDPQPAGPVARALERFEQRQRTGIDRSITQAGRP